LKQEQSKKLIPEAVIIVAAVFGLWSVVVSPMRDELGLARAASQDAIEHTRIAGDPELSIPRLSAVRLKVDDAIGEIDRRSAVVSDQTALQAELTTTGEATGVRIDRVSPAQTRATGSSGFDDRSVSFEIECSGLYRDIVRFISVVERGVGFTRIERISVRPDRSAGGSAVRARLRTTHFAFDTSPPPVEIDPAGQGN